MKKEIRIRMEFEKGGVLTGVLREDWAPETVKAVTSALPAEGKTYHTRWCGREVSFGIDTPVMPPKEDTTCCVSKYDICYWRPWDRKEKTPEAQSFESVAFYYGAEHLEYHGGLLDSVIIGHIDYELEEELEEIGTRCWQQGPEGIRMTLVTN